MQSTSSYGRRSALRVWLCEELARSLTEIDNLRLRSLSHHVVMDCIEVHLALISEIVIHVGRFLCSGPALFVAKDEINP